MTKIFSPEQLRQLVEQNLPPDPGDGKTHALIGTVDQNGAQVLAVMKFTNVWQLQAAARHDWNGDNEVGAKIIARW